MKFKSVQLIVLAWMFCASSLLAQTASHPDRANISLILSVEGKVEILSASASTWLPAKPKQELKFGDRLRTSRYSRAIVQLTDASVLRIHELTTLQILPPQVGDKRPLLDLKGGSVFFFSREKPADLQFRTPLSTGAIRGTEFELTVAESGLTLVSLLDGAIELTTMAGGLTLKSGDQAKVEPGQPPQKSPLLNAVNVIQWTLYYPAVLDPADLGLSAAEQRDLQASLEAYRAGDLGKAFASYPEGKETSSDAMRIYAAGLRLAVGKVDEAEQLLAGTGRSVRAADALRLLIATVRNETRARPQSPDSTSEWMAESYHRQARFELAEALEAARHASRRSPTFGFAWIRVAELEFSFGRIAAARDALEKGLQHSPRHAEGLALKGYLLLAENKPDEALASFNKAIDADGALGNAWAGRGLARMRLGHHDAARQDLQTAVTLESNRSVLRSALGKAFAQTGQVELAEKEFELAKKIDANDPTPWLYGSLLNQRESRINEAVRDLETSQRLNDNRQLFRSRFLLDQDRAVRSANLASIYRDAGLFEVSLREASRAAAADYANASGHLFLANSYGAMRDPKSFNLRHETAEISELFVGNLLAPAGGENLSRNHFVQDYARWVEGRTLGISSLTEYFSSGDWNQFGTLHGMVDGTSYAFDSAYRSENGQRPNNDLEHLTLSLQLKQQLTPQDSIFVQGLYFKGESGDVSQYYDQVNEPSAGLRVKEKQEPNVFLGYHREWHPGLHTLFLAGRLDDTLELNDPATRQPFLQHRGGAPLALIDSPFFQLASRREFEAFSAELQQIWQTENQTLIAGARYQTGELDVASDLFRTPFGPRFNRAVSGDLERLNLYAYEQWSIIKPLQLIAGIAYERVEFPDQIDLGPIGVRRQTEDQVSPKVGVVIQPWSDTALRAAYTRSLGGLFYDNSIRLEPTQIAGFTQAFRSVAPESAIGFVPGTEFETFGAGLDHKFRTGTYIVLEGEILRSDGARTVGVVTNSHAFLPIPDGDLGVRQELEYEEKSGFLTLNQLLGREWSLGARYRISEASLNDRWPQYAATASGTVRDLESRLHQVNFFILFNHASGVFSQANSVWSQQSNKGYAPDRPGDDFWQHHIFIGYRFAGRVAEVRLGILNLADQDYQLNPLNLYSELPRERTFTASLRLNF
ncbi:MAG: TonB-dependent receptor [Verrucomicrobiota bacterium]